MQVSLETLLRDSVLPVVLFIKLYMLVISFHRGMKVSATIEMTATEQYLPWLIYYATQGGPNFASVVKIL